MNSVFKLKRSLTDYLYTKDIRLHLGEVKELKRFVLQLQFFGEDLINNLLSLAGLNGDPR